MEESNIWITIVTILFALSLISERVTNLIKLNCNYFQKPDPLDERTHEKRVLWLAIGSGIFVAVLSGADFFWLIEEGRLIDYNVVFGDETKENSKNEIGLVEILGFFLSGFFISLGSKFWHDVLEIVLSFSRLQKYRAKEENEKVDNKMHPKVPQPAFPSEYNITKNSIFEQVVDPFNSPAFLIQSNHNEQLLLSEENKQIINNDPTKTQAFNKLITYRDNWEPLSLATCKIFAENMYDDEVVASGWAFHPNFIITAEHTFNEYKDGKLFVKFPYEYERNSGFKIPVQVHFLDKSLDLAILRSEEKLDFFFPIQRIDQGTHLTDNQLSAIIAYPASREMSEYTEVFGENWRETRGYKRISPGTSHPSKDDPNLIYHTCSSLRGSSGGPIVNLKNGKIIGMHIDKYWGNRNKAIKGSIILDKLRNSTALPNLDDLPNA